MAVVTPASFEAQSQASFLSSCQTHSIGGSQFYFHIQIMLNTDSRPGLHFYFLRLLVYLESGSDICCSEQITNKENKVKASIRWGLAQLQSRHMASILMRDISQSRKTQLKSKLTNSRQNTYTECGWSDTPPPMAQCLVKASQRQLCLLLGSYCTIWLAPCVSKDWMTVQIPRVYLCQVPLCPQSCTINQNLNIPKPHLNLLQGLQNCTSVYSI